MHEVRAGVSTNDVQAAFQVESSCSAKYAIDKHRTALIDQLFNLAQKKRDMIEAGLEDVWTEQMVSSKRRLAELDDTDDEK